MKKEFLDEIYELRSLVVADIARLVRDTNVIEVDCKHCKQNSSNEMFAELRTRRSQLSSIDGTIKSYIKHHGCSA